jgi:hypothetical protein
MHKLPTAMMACSALLMVCLGLSVTPAFQSPALAQSPAPRQFAFSIKQRKVDAETNVIRVSQGDIVDLTLTADESAELHLHGYDLKLSLAPNVPGTLHFTANIAGRFPLEAHQFGSGESSGRHHSEGPLLYVEVLPR